MLTDEKRPDMVVVLSLPHRMRSSRSCDLREHAVSGEVSARPSCSRFRPTHCTHFSQLVAHGRSAHLTPKTNCRYFMLYDRTKSRFDRRLPSLAPVFAGIPWCTLCVQRHLLTSSDIRIPGLLARTVTVCITAPLELMRTYVQSRGKSTHTQKGKSLLL